MTAVLKSPATATFHAQRADSEGTLPELTRVELVGPFETSDGSVIPGGARGTVVAVWADGRAYDVEFTQPVAGLATLEGDRIRRFQS